MKKFISLVLALVMALSLTTVAWGATVTVGTGGTYATMQEAVDAAGSGGTVVLKSNVNGDGVVIDQDVTIDLNGFVYTIDGNTVGDRHTNTLGMQILKDNTVTIMNGTIVGSDDADRPAMPGCPTSCAYCNGEADYGVKMVIQNYADLTLDGVTVTGNSKAGYVVSNNCGDVVIEDTTINAAAGKVAFDVCDYSTYTGVSVTVKGNSVINGKIELSDGNTGDSDVTKLVIENGTINGAIDVATSDMAEDVTISGGTFSVAPDEDYLADGLELTADGVVVAEGGAALGTKYDLVTTDVSATKTVGVTVATFSAKAAKDRDKTGFIDQEDDLGNVKYMVFSNMNDKYFVQVNSVKKADYTVYQTGTETVFGYFKEIASPKYLGNGVAFYDFGEKCGQYDETPEVGAKYYTFQGVLFQADESYTSDVNLMVGNELTPVVALDDEFVDHAPVFTYDKDYKVVAVECAECGTDAVIYANYAAVPKADKLAGNAYPVNDNDYYSWLEGPVADTDTDKDDKVESAETFDAGIAMYVGMSVMAAAGSVVVLKKKD